MSGRTGPGSIIVTVNNTGGLMCSVNAESHWCIRDLKSAIETATGTCALEQRLFHSCSELADSRLLPSVSCADADLLLVRREVPILEWKMAVVNGLSLLHAPAGIRGDRSVARILLRCRPEELQFLSDELRSDPEIVALAVHCGGSSMFQFATEAARGDRAIVHAILVRPRCCFDGILRYASSALRDDKAFMMELVGVNGRHLEFASERLRGDRAVVVKALRLSGARVLDFASPEACEYPQVHRLLGAIRAQDAVGSGFELTAVKRQKRLVGRNRRNRGNGGRDAHKIAKSRPRRGGRYKANRFHYVNMILSEEVCSWEAHVQWIQQPKSY